MAIEFLVKIKDIDLEDFDELDFMNELETALKGELTEEEGSIESIAPTKSTFAGIVFSVIVAPAIGAVIGEVTKKVIKKIFKKTKEKSQDKDTEVEVRDQAGSKTFRSGSDEEINRLLYI